MKKFNIFRTNVFFLGIATFVLGSECLFLKKKPIVQLVNDPLQVKEDILSSKNIFSWFNLKTHIKFRLWTRKNSLEAQELRIGNVRMLRESNYDPRKLSKVIIHGFAHSANEVYLEEWIVDMKDTYLGSGNVNVVVIDYTLMALPYLYWMDGPELATEQLCSLVKFLEKEGAKLKDFHFIGYSWGAHVAGNCGHLLKGKIGRITGLDPAAPFYKLIENQYRLDKEDAKFVDIIHTNMNGLGLQTPLGHADFFPNSGDSQPGCPTYWLYPFETFECDHSRSVGYFIESIEDGTAFPACPCSDWDSFVQGKCLCKESDVAFMGENILKNVSGSFFLFTRGEKPYGMGSKNLKSKKRSSRHLDFIEEILKKSDDDEKMNYENEQNNTRKEESQNNEDETEQIGQKLLNRGINVPLPLSVRLKLNNEGVKRKELADELFKIFQYPNVERKPEKNYIQEEIINNDSERLLLDNLDLEFNKHKSLDDSGSITIKVPIIYHLNESRPISNINFFNSHQVTKYNT